MFRNLGLAPDQSADLFARLIGLVHPDDRAEAEREFAAARTVLGPMRIEVRLGQVSEDPHWIVFLGRVAADADGRPEQMRGITIVSTWRRRGEEEAAVALRETEQRLRDLSARLAQRAERRGRALGASRAQMQAIFDNTPDWLTLFRATADGRFIYEDMNRATEIAYGLSRDQVVGRPLEEVFGAEPAQLPLSLMRECIRTGENQRYTARRSMAGSTRTIDVMFVRVPEKYQGDNFIMATARDITERETIEARLRQSQKIEAIGQLTGGLAHDFNNLLTAVIGNLELLDPRISSDSHASKYVDRGPTGGRERRQAYRAAAGLLAPPASAAARGRPQRGDRAACTTCWHARSARRSGCRPCWRRKSGRRSSIRRRSRWRSSIWRSTRATRCRSAALLTIETRNLARADDPVPAEIAGDNCIRVTVRDTGTGMTEEVQRAAIEPFFTTKDVGKGSGLGLSQVYGMVQQSNGTLQIESRLGVGTAVHLYLPGAAAAEAASSDGERAQRNDRTSGRILVVDDDPGVREVTVQMLREFGYGVAEADTGHAALDALARGEVYDLLLIDIAMPGLTGLETVRRARSAHPGLRVLYVTGYADLIGDDHRSGGDPLIKKPFRLAELGAEVRAAIRRSPTGAIEGNVVQLPKSAAPQG